jgi:hypothetical protein
MMRGGQRVSAALWLAAITRVAGYGQTPPAAEPEIVTDHRDITECSIVVPKGSLEFENGPTWTSDHRQTALDLPETLVRFGVSDRTELRIVAPNYLDALVSALGQRLFWRIH